MKFTKRPVTVDSIKFTGDNAKEIAAFMGQDLPCFMNGKLCIKTLEGDMLATPGDWIIKGVKGEFYPCKPDIFEKTYKPVDNPTVSMGITVYGNPGRLARLLTNLRWSGFPPQVNIRVFEDPYCKGSPAERDAITSAYEDVCREHKLSFYRAPSWGCMHKIGQWAVMNSPEDWFIYMPDDVLVTPGFVDSIVENIYKYNDSSAGLFQVPYWNAHEYPGGFPSGKKDYLWNCGYDEMKDFLTKVPCNKHWDHEGVPRPYINVNGVGFVLRRRLWEMVGGFSPDTWSLDEDISARCWMFSPYNIFTLPGPTSIHLFAGTTADGTQPHHQYHTMDSWIKSWGMNKGGTGKLCYAAGKVIGKFTHTIDTMPLRPCGYFHDANNESEINAVSMNGMVRRTVR